VKDITLIESKAGTQAFTAPDKTVAKDGVSGNLLNLAISGNANIKVPFDIGECKERTCLDACV
jgi:hypothetical protein